MDYIRNLLRRYPRDLVLSAALVLSTLGLMQSLGRDWPLAAAACALVMVGSLSALSMRTER